MSLTITANDWIRFTFWIYIHQGTWKFTDVLSGLDNALQWMSCHSVGCKSLHSVTHTFKIQGPTSTLIITNMRLAVSEMVVLMAGLFSVVLASLTTMFLVSIEIPDSIKVKKSMI